VGDEQAPCLYRCAGLRNNPPWLKLCIACLMLVTPHFPLKKGNE
jgi:hypothetical protein